MRNVVLALVFSVGIVRAEGMAPHPACAQIEQSINKIIDILKQPELARADRRRQVSSILAAQFDFLKMGELSLAKEWRKLGDSDRQEFAALFRTLIESTYFRNLENYTNEKVEVGGALAKGKKAIVETRVITSSKEIPIHYKMLPKGDRWLVYDIKIEGVSMISTYRGQFKAAIRKKSYDGLVRQLKAKVEVAAQCGA